MVSSEMLQGLFPEEGAVPESARVPVPVEQREYLIDGEIRTWDGPMQKTLSPICLRRDGALTQAVTGRYPLMPEEEALAALDAAVRAFDCGRGAWPTMSVRERIARVEQLALGMRGKREEVVRLLMWEIGKSRPNSEKEFDRTVDYIVATVEALKDLDRVSSRFTIEQGIFAQIRRAPLGVVLCMGPYNYPLNETFTLLIPALIMGNTVVFKPPHQGGLSQGPLFHLFQEAFPKGVVNTVYGRGRQVVPPLMASGKIDALAFIGSSSAADSIKKQHPRPHRLRSILGLGAKNAGILLADADLETAVKECVLGSLSFNGQRCTALKILFVHRTIADEFVGRFSAAVSALAPGMPWDPGVAVTPLPELERVQLMGEFVEDARARGAAVVNKGGGTSAGTLFYPAVVYPVGEGMRVYTEEQFGPVVPVVPFDDLDVPIRYVVESTYGQQVSLFGSDPALLARLIDPLVNQVCRVNLNSQCQRGPDAFPFTGRKDSAEGTLSVSDALRCFSIRTLVAAKMTDQNREIATRITREHQSSFLSTDFIL